MTPREFFYVVAQMREAQTRYFANRTQQNLRLSKYYERKVDGEIARAKYLLSIKENGGDAACSQSGPQVD